MSSTRRPTTQEAIDFFKRYREKFQSEVSSKNSPSHNSVNISAPNIVTQVQQGGQADVTAYSIVPMDPRNGTTLTRLDLLRNSSTNRSPCLEMDAEVKAMLPPLKSVRVPKVTLVLDVDETLVHSTFQPNPDVVYDKVLQVPSDGKIYTVSVKYRPYLKDFLQFVCQRFEVVIFTASMRAYCDNLMDEIDPNGDLGNLRLFREHCTLCESSYVKDLHLLGRDLRRVAIIDNSPAAYAFQQRNAIPIRTWIDDPDDRELFNLLPLLDRLARCEHVYSVLDEFNAKGCSFQ
ncbi:nuclear lim interactor-interacting factor-like protein [Leptomonas pyrrhocoris]|uniref:Nuclear lim interactor-interacting factor-like protein n=1 Tax=Leptomonas pyrrhocoris TaxID=157538 RepID=A0A0M9GB56_LEPPY|nr:nuclear lim interactor-interacting factor-like protein [Leptomonas pyrrhocoris]KPA86713.1 nuclear lim interactor-interacting factor-like protein [Leptomonas pyrrhocoris]|eukprot:XP_015665152.1 nuclear lim interactor-interacting factor-like protein [Leptomonas pyrrhocoris]